MIGEKSLLHSKPLDYKTEGHLEPLSSITRAHRVLVPTARGCPAWDWHAQRDARQDVVC